MTIKPIPGFTAAMRDACVNIIEVPATAVSENDLDFAYWRRGRNDAAAELRAMPVAPMFPEPMRELPEYGQEIWIVNLSRLSFCEEWAWAGGTYNMRDFHNGLVHASKEAAEAHGGYLASLSAKTEDAA